MIREHVYLMHMQHLRPHDSWMFSDKNIWDWKQWPCHYLGLIRTFNHHGLNIHIRARELYEENTRIHRGCGTSFKFPSASSRLKRKLNHLRWSLKPKWDHIRIYKRFAYCWILETFAPLCSVEDLTKMDFRSPKGLPCR